MSITFDRKQIENWEEVAEGYRLDRHTCYGGGCFGKVYRGYSDHLQTLIAIKVVPFDKFDSRQTQTLQALSTLTHKYIMQYYGSHSNSKLQQHYLMLENCPGGTLSDAIKKGITQKRALKMFRQLVEGMCYMNVKEKIHRDLKPDNILIGAHDDIKISDFGLARGAAGIEKTGKLGTPLYAAPEVFLNEQEKVYGPSCDVWGAGLILHELVTGRSLLQRVRSYESLKQAWLLMQRGELVANINSQYHPLWECFCNWMLQFDPSRRPKFQEVLTLLKKVFKLMSAQIEKGQSEYLNADRVLVMRYVGFEVSKYTLLLDLCQAFTQVDIRLHNQHKYILMVFAIMRFISFGKQMARQLRYRRISYEGQALIMQPPSDEEGPSAQWVMMEMLLDNHRLLLEHRCEFYQAQVKHTLVPRILDVYCKRASSREALSGLEEELKTVQDIREDQPIFDQELFAQSMKSVYHAIAPKGIQQSLKQYNKQQLQIYSKMLNAILLQEIHPVTQLGKVSPEQVRNRLQLLNSMPQSQLPIQIRKMVKTLNKNKQ